MHQCSSRRINQHESPLTQMRVLLVVHGASMHHCAHELSKSCSICSGCTASAAWLVDAPQINFLLAQMGVLPVVHGSALVSQGDSQALVTATVADPREQAKSEGITGVESRQLMVQLSDRTAATSQVCLPIRHPWHP